METTHCRRRLAAAGFAFAALPIIGVAAAPTSLADPCDWDVASLDCMMNSGDGFGDFGNSGGFQPGDLVLPATGGPPQVAVAPAPDGGPVVTAGGDVVIPGAPPIG
ncbi:MAG: hypothetical protein O3B27_11055 [Actinomycetota bacterium]|jgi:hypothetical protein|nr:hypothetical protein [Actinomycetota bacterium]MDA2948831.1 hypothetical protein [Actinomycetota bacterium]MDA2992080.1 hypothetical protein [Actinomycetota bacterium]